MLSEGQSKAGATGVGVWLSFFGEQAVVAEDWETVGKNVERFILRCSAA
ncbi:hypothetical protein ACFLZQ_01425 [Thermodesulfobacteriota bacterium]